MSEPDFPAMRRAMVESQLRTTGVNDPRVVAAMAAVPREHFVPAERRSLAYMDRPVALGNGRALNPPEATGRLLTAAQIRADDRVLIVGAATGYTAAVVIEIAPRVTALEQAAFASNVPGVAAVKGPLAEGWQAGAPYDLIIVDGLIEHIPDALVAQLADGGRLACALLDGGASRLAIGRKSGAGFGLDLFADCEAAPLPGFARAPSFVF